MLPTDPSSATESDNKILRLRVIINKNSNMSDFIPFSGGGGPGGGRGGRHGGGGRRNKNNHNNHRRGGGGGRGRGRGRGGGGRFHRGGGVGMPRNHDITHDRIEILGTHSETTLNIAVEGCCHGELDPIYDRLVAHEKQTGQKVDLLICCGDFQSFRNPGDFHSCSMPPKYRRLGSFPRYYAGEKKAPILTLFIGGNHEASQPLRELYYGGWAAPNIYYLGAVGIVRYGGLRIGGISGIYKSHDYEKGHYESAPYDHSSLRSVYHVRNVDIFRMKCLSHSTSRVDIIASHDWPLGIEQHGNTQALIRQKPFFRAEIERNDLGSPPNRQVLDGIKPRWWFSAHLHVKFAATVDHPKKNGKEGEAGKDAASQLVPSQVKTTTAPSPSKMDEGAQQDTAVDAEAILEANNASVEPVEDSVGGDKQQTAFVGLESTCDTVDDLTELMTRFLALDKCLPRRKYLSILHVEAAEGSKENATLEFDPEWLAVLRKTHQLNSVQSRRVEIPESTVKVSQEEIEWVEGRLKEKNVQPGNEGSIPASSFRAISTDFVPTVPFYPDPIFQSRNMCPPFPPMGNPQTDFLLDLLELDHVVTQPYDNSLTPQRISEVLQGYMEPPPPPPPPPIVIDENEIELDGDDQMVEVEDDNEIEIDDNDNDEDSPSEDPAQFSQPEEANTKKPRLDE